MWVCGQELSKTESSDEKTTCKLWRANPLLPALALQLKPSGPAFR
jgi:hypothetical protein